MEIWPVSVYVSSKLPSIMIAFKGIYEILAIFGPSCGSQLHYEVYELVIPSFRHTNMRRHTYTKPKKYKKMNPYNHVMMSDQWYVVLLKFSLHSRYVVILTGCTSTSIFRSCVMLCSLVYCAFIWPFQSHICCYVLSFSWCTMKYFHHCTLIWSYFLFHRFGICFECLALCICMLVCSDLIALPQCSSTHFSRRLSLPCLCCHIL